MENTSPAAATQIDGGIVAYIQVTTYAFNFGITADEGTIKNDLV